MLPPPRNRKTVARYAAASGLHEGSDDWDTFFDLAAAAAGLVPADIMSDAELVNALPVVFRTLRRQESGATQRREISARVC